MRVMSFFRTHIFARIARDETRRRLRPGVLVLLLCLAGVTLADTQEASHPKRKRVQATAGKNTLTVRALNDKPGPILLRVEGRDTTDMEILGVLAWDDNDNQFSDETLMIPSNISVLRFTFINDRFGGDAGGPDLDRNARIDSFAIGDYRFEAEDFDRTGGTDINPLFRGCSAKGFEGASEGAVADCGNQNDWVEYDIEQVGVAIAKPDSMALVALYDFTDGSNWSNNTNWLDSPILSWSGVRVSEGRVTSLNLRDNRLAGAIPGALGNLTDLVDLDLGFNRLTGSIPVALGNLNVLEVLSLDRNQLSGSIPASLGSLSLLEVLSLDRNQLTRQIPGALGKLGNLLELNLGFNQLMGTIPDSLGNLENLEILDLGFNQLTGAIPDVLGTLSRLEFLLLQNNQFDVLPDLNNLGALVTLRLENNRLTFEDIVPNIDVASGSFILQPPGQGRYSAHDIAQ